MLIIEVDRCNGCGACVQACPQGAISLVEGVARIDSSLCAECQACVDACPTGAIQMAMPIARKAEAAIAVHEERTPVTMMHKGTLATLAAATLTFMGRYLLPRAAEAIINALEQRPSQRSGIASPGQSVPPPPSTSAATGGGRSVGGRRRRHRGG